MVEDYPVDNGKQSTTKVSAIVPVQVHCGFKCEIKILNQIQFSEYCPFAGYCMGGNCRKAIFICSLVPIQ